MSEFEKWVLLFLIAYFVALIPIIAGFVYLEGALLRIARALEDILHDR